MGKYHKHNKEFVPYGVTEWDEEGNEIHKEPYGIERLSELDIPEDLLIDLIIAGDKSLREILEGTDFDIHSDVDPYSMAPEESRYFKKDRQEEGLASSEDIDYGIYRLLERLEGGDILPYLATPKRAILYGEYVPSVKDDIYPFSTSAPDSSFTYIDPKIPQGVVPKDFKTRNEKNKYIMENYEQLKEIVLDENIGKLIDTIIHETVFHGIGGIHHGVLDKRGYIFEGDQFEYDTMVNEFIASMYNTPELRSLYDFVDKSLSERTVEDYTESIGGIEHVEEHFDETGHLEIDLGRRDEASSLLDWIYKTPFTVPEGDLEDNILRMYSDYKSRKRGDRKLPYSPYAGKR